MQHSLYKRQPVASKLAAASTNGCEVWCCLFGHGGVIAEGRTAYDFQDEPITVGNRLSTGPTLIDTWVQSTVLLADRGTAPPNWESSLQLADAMQHAVRLAAGRLLLLLYVGQGRRYAAEEGLGGRSSSSADVWYCNNAALFPTVTILLPLPGIVAPPQCHHGNARVKTSFLFLAPAEPHEPYNPTHTT